MDIVMDIVKLICLNVNWLSVENLLLYVQYRGYHCSTYCHEKTSAKNWKNISWENIFCPTKQDKVGAANQCYIDGDGSFVANRPLNSRSYLAFEKISETVDCRCRCRNRFVWTAPLILLTKTIGLIQFYSEYGDHQAEPHQHYHSRQKHNCKKGHIQTKRIRKRLFDLRNIHT